MRVQEEAMRELIESELEASGGCPWLIEWLEGFR